MPTTRPWQGLAAVAVAAAAAERAAGCSQMTDSASSNLKQPVARACRRLEASLDTKRTFGNQGMGDIESYKQITLRPKPPRPITNDTKGSVLKGFANKTYGFFNILTLLHSKSP